MKTRNKNQSIYQLNGYRNRSAYLQGVADDYAVDIGVVHAIADLLGPTEDFDGLISTIEDYNLLNQWTGEGNY